MARRISPGVAHQSWRGALALA